MILHLADGLRTLPEEKAMLNTDKLIILTLPLLSNYTSLPSVSALLLLLLESFQHSWQELGNGMLMSFSPEQSITQELQFKKRNQTA